MSHCLRQLFIIRYFNFPYLYSLFFAPTIVTLRQYLYKLFYANTFIIFHYSHTQFVINCYKQAHSIKYDIPIPLDGQTQVIIKAVVAG
jgi:hypothetical protein